RRRVIGRNLIMAKFYEMHLMRNIMRGNSKRKMRYSLRQGCSLMGIKGGKVPSVNRPCNPSVQFSRTVQLYFQSHSVNEKHLQSYQLVSNNAFQQVFSCCFLPLP
ncbi:hypothetical protein T310_9922, partial [Rasamsonia emersonii CBS 393.64]